jgi:hypothetical protein
MLSVIEFSRIRTISRLICVYNKSSQNYLSFILQKITSSHTPAKFKQCHLYSATNCDKFKSVYCTLKLHIATYYIPRENKNVVTLNEKAQAYMYSQ